MTPNEKPIKFYSSTPETVHYERQCGECNMCCKWLFYSINGHVKYPGKPCFYLADKCTVHDIRPQSCRDYHCAYMQGILPEWMKPSRSNVLVNIEPWGANKEYKMLKAIECGQKLDVEILSWLIEFSRATDTGLVYQLNGIFHYFGPDEFMKFFEKTNLDLQFEDFKNPFMK